MKPVLFTVEAEADGDEAFRWYEAQRPGLGAGFRRALDIAVEAVGSRPATYAIIHPDEAAISSGRRGPHR